MSHGQRQHAKKNLVKFIHVVELYKKIARQTDRQTERLITILCTPLGGKAISEE